MFDLSYNPYINAPGLAGLDVMNMSKKEDMESIGRVYIKQHMLSRRIKFQPSINNNNELHGSLSS